MRRLRLIAIVARDWAILAVLTVIAAVFIAPLAVVGMALVVLDEALERYKHE